MDAKNFSHEDLSNPSLIIYLRHTNVGACTIDGDVLEIAETAADPKTKLQARAIANDCYKYIMDLTTNGVVITDALKYVTQKTEQVNTLQKLDERIKAAEEGEETTTHGVF
jgi:hypothetical protein